MNRPADELIRLLNFIGAMAVAIMSRTKNEMVEKPIAIQRRIKMAKVAIAFLFVLALAYVGHRGKRQASLQVRLEAVTVIRDQLQRQLDERQRMTGLLGGAVRGTTTDVRQSPLSDPQIKASVDTLKKRLEEFESDVLPHELPGVEELEVRLCKATLSIAEQCFADALTTITEEDEKVERANNESHVGRYARVFQIRGDSFYGLHDWRRALECYRQLLVLQPNHLVTIARVADCYVGLGQQNEALITYAKLAKALASHGNSLRGQGTLDAAIRQYERAIELQSRLTKLEGRSEWAIDLATSHEGRGNTFAVQRKLDAAIADYDKAIEIRTRLVERQGQSELEDDLAKCHANRAIARYVQGKLDAAIADYDKVIEIYARISQRGQCDVENDLAMSYATRGNVLLTQRKIDSAIGDFDKAIEIRARLIQEEGRSELANDLAMSYATRGNALLLQRKLDAAIGNYNSAIELQTRIIEQEGRNELAGDLARTYTNRGIARHAQGNLRTAIRDYRKAIETLTPLVEHDGKSELGFQLAKSLNLLAWLYATSPDMSLRNGNKAHEYAHRACELTDWKSSELVETLAAACAETGNFADAVKWQQNAISLAPDNRQAELRSRLQWFKSGRPYRTSPTKTE